MATLTKRGLASVTGVTGTFDVIIYPVQQTVKGSHAFEEEIVKDVQGQDTAWIARNEHIMLDVMMKLLGDTAAHAATGAAFLAPLAVVTLSGFTPAYLNTTFEVVPGSDISQVNTATGDISFKLRRYVDSQQNTLAATVPS
jgi:hypothetical protein